MLRRLLRFVLPLVLACTLGLKFAHAAISTWVDASGAVNMSNLAPPEGVRVISVVQESPPRIAPRADAEHDAAREQQVQVLSDRVRQLEYEAEFTRRMAPPPPAPVYQQSFPPVQYSQFPPDYAPTTGSGCDPSWAGCAGWWSPYGYPAIVVVQQPNFRRNHPIHGGPNLPVRRPMGSSNVASRR